MDRLIVTGERVLCRRAPYLRRPLWGRNLRSHAVLVAGSRGGNRSRRRRGPRQGVIARVLGGQLRQGSRGRQRREAMMGVRRRVARSLRRARERREHRPHRRPCSAPGDAPPALRDARQATRARPEVRRRPVADRVARERRVEVLVVNHCLDEVAEQDSFFGLAVGDGELGRGGKQLVEARREGLVGLAARVLRICASIDSLSSEKFLDLVLIAGIREREAGSVRRKAV